MLNLDHLERLAKGNEALDAALQNLAAGAAGHPRSSV
jgi:hypothetical protein